MQYRPSYRSESSCMRQILIRATDCAARGRYSTSRTGSKPATERRREARACLRAGARKLLVLPAMNAHRAFGLCVTLLRADDPVGAVVRDAQRGDVLVHIPPVYPKPPAHRLRTDCRAGAICI